MSMSLEQLMSSFTKTCFERINLCKHFSSSEHLPFLLCELFLKINDDGLNFLGTHKMDYYTCLTETGELKKSLKDFN